MADMNKNEELLEELIFGLEMSQGEFRLFLARCNYISQRDRLIQQLRDSFSGNLKEWQLDESTKELYATIRKPFKTQPPDALMIWGLEAVKDIDKLLVSIGFVREEFRKNFQFPIILWVDGEVSRKFIRLIPDFENWTSLTIFETSTDELTDFIQKTCDSVYQQVLETGAGVFLDHIALGLSESIYSELTEAWQELENRGVELYPELEASLEFTLGRVAAHSSEAALQHYQNSLERWQQLNNVVRIAHTNYYLGLWWRSYATRNLVEKEKACRRACEYFQESIETFERANRPDLAAKFINAWGEVLQILERWDELETVANQAISLHKTYTYPFREARAYGFLAEVLLSKNNYNQAKKLAQKSLKNLNNILSNICENTSDKTQCIVSWEYYYHQGWYLFTLAKAEKGLGEIEAAIKALKVANKETKPEYDPELYIYILKTLQDIYYQNKNYLKAFELKQEQQKIEQEFGFHAFIGANRLRDRKVNLNPALPHFYQQNNPQKPTQELSASGRQFDVDKLLERISRPDYKLIVIHGQSGVGKSSILEAGLIPALDHKSIDTRDVVVVLQPVYVNWISGLGERLAKQLKKTQKLAVNAENLNSINGIATQLEQNNESNLLTVIIFDQFEEFFFANLEPRQKREFARFLKTCLNIPFVKIVLSLREDYIHYLLEFNRLGNLDTISNDILNKNILYYLGNFSQKQANSVIQELTQNSQFKIDADLRETLVEDLAKELGEIRPIELQIVGSQLQAENITTIECYQKLDTHPKAELVERYLAAVVRDCGKENEKLAWLVLMLLTDENNTRPLRTKADLVKEIEFDGENLELILHIFVNSGLVFLLPEKPEDHYQLVHDYLVSFIRQRKGLETLEELAEEREKRQQLQKTVVIGSVAASLVMLVLAVGITMFGRQAQQEKRRAATQTIIAQASEARASLILDERLNELLIAMKATQKLIDAKVKKTSDTSKKITNYLQVAVYKHDHEIRELNRFEGHENWVWGVAFSPDGEIIASASADNTVKLWNHQGRLLKTLKSHEDQVNSVAFSPDGKTIASTSDDKTVKLWNLQGQLLRTLEAHQDRVYNLAFSPNGEIIASASIDNTVKLWNLQGKLLTTLEGHQDQVNSVAFSPDGETIASASDDKTVKFWNLKGQLLRTLEAHQDRVYNVAFSPNGEIIASASADQTVRLWNLQRQLLVTLKGHQDRIWGLAFSPDGEIIASASDDNTVKLWNRQGQLLQTLKGHKDSVWGLAFSPDGETIASASADRTVRLWNFQRRLLQTLKSHEEQVNSVTFSPNGKTIASASDDKTVKLWNRQGILLQTLVAHQDQVNSVAFSPDGEIIASASRDKTVKLWNVQGELLQTLKDHKETVWGVAFSLRGEIIASASADQTVKLWNRQGQLLHTLKGHQDQVNSVAFSPDGEIIASSSDDNTVKLWNLWGQLLQTLEGHQDRVYSVAFSPDGETIASASIDKTVRLWNRQGQLLQTLEGHQDRVYSVAFSPDGETIASASLDKTVRLWSPQGQLLNMVEYEDKVNSVAFSPDGETIASASIDKTVRLLTEFSSLSQIEDIEDLTQRGCEWLNDYLITHAQQLEELKICQTDSRLKAAARSWVVEGEKLARDRNIEEAVVAFEKALVWNPDLNFDPKIKAESLAEAEKLMEEGTKTAREGKIEAAIKMYQNAIAIDQKVLIPTLQNINPEAKAKYEASKVILDNGKKDLQQGKVKEAIDSYKQAEKIDPTLISADDWFTLCRYGSLYKQAAEVMFACEKAVNLTPKDGGIIDSRGLARALTGDIQGAIKDFQVYVEWTENEENKAKRQDWIKKLQAGENPFTDEVLKELRNE